MLLFNPNLKAEVTRAWSRSDFGESVRHFRETLDSSAECLVATYSADITRLATHAIMAIATKLLAMFNTLSQVGSFFLVIVLLIISTFRSRLIVVQ